MDSYDIVQRWKDEGRREGRDEGWLEGRREGLLIIYRTRFGAVPRKVRAAVERTRDDAVLARWIKFFVTQSEPEIVAAVAAKNVALTALPRRTC